MALSTFNITVQDGNLGLVSSSGSENVVKFDVSTKGTPGVFQVFNTLTNLTSSLGLGSLVENAGYHLAIAGGPVSVVSLEPSVAGSIGSVTHVGSGTGTITVTAAPHAQIALTIVGGGARGVGTFTYQVGSDPTSAPLLIPSAGTLRIPGTYTQVTFAAGTYVAADSYTISTLGVVSETGTSPSVTQASSPIDDYNVTLTLASAGAVGTARLTYSLDGYNTSPSVLSAAAYAIPNSGLVLHLSGTFNANDTYSFQTCGPTFASADFTAAIAALNLQTPFSMLHVNNKSATASAAATFATVVDTALSTLFNSAMFCRAMMNTPSAGTVATSAGSLAVCADTISTIESAFLNEVSTRLGCGAYDAYLSSPVSGLTLRRNFSWVAMTRLASLDPATDAAWVQLGGLSGVAGISANEFLTEGLSDAGFTVPTTIQGNPGFYVNQALTFSYKVNSDFSYWTNARVMDLACNTVRKAGVGLLNSKVATKGDGTIAEQSAKLIESRLNSALATSVVGAVPQQAVAASAQVDRGHNISQDGKLFITVAIKPFAYARSISVTIGFSVA